MSTLLVTYNEAVKGLKLTWDYKFNLETTLLEMYNNMHNRLKG